MTAVSNSEKKARSVPVPKLYKVAANVFKVRKLFLKPPFYLRGAYYPTKHYTFLLSEGNSGLNKNYLKGYSDV